MKKILINMILLSTCVFAKEELEFKTQINKNKEIVIKVQKKENDIKNSLENIDIYKIKWGDTLSEISRKFKVPMKSIVLVNEIKNPDFILAGAKLIIPR